MKVHVKILDKEYEVIINDIKSRPVEACIDGETYEVWPEENEKEIKTRDQIQSVQIGPTNLQIQETDEKIPHSCDDILAPIPGVIIDVCANPGDSVELGQELIILEAMKMKNSIKSNREGIIERIPVNKGDQVQHGQLLVEFKK